MPTRTPTIGLSYVSDGTMNANLDRLDGFSARVFPGGTKQLALSQPMRFINGTTTTITTTEASFGTVFLNRNTMAYPEATLVMEVSVSFTNGSAGPWSNATCELFWKLDGVKMGNNKIITIPSVPVGLTIFPTRTIASVVPPASGDGAVTVWMVTSTAPPASCTITVIDQVVGWLTYLAYR